MRAFALSSSSSSSSSDDDDDDRKSSMSLAAPPGEEEKVAEEEDVASSRAAMRFRVELEFVQCLAGPFYLHWLAQHEYLEKSEFLVFLKYLRYWKRPEYAQFIEFPDCLDFLDRLCDDEDFRRQLKFVEFRDKLDREQFKKWRDAFFLKNVPQDLLVQQKRVEAEYLSRNGMPPPPEFYRDHPHLDRESVEKEWIYPLPIELMPTVDENRNVLFDGQCFPPPQ